MRCSAMHKRRPTMTASVMPASRAVSEAADFNGRIFPMPRISKIYSATFSGASSGFRVADTGKVRAAKGAGSQGGHQAYPRRNRLWDRKEDKPESLAKMRGLWRLGSGGGRFKKDLHDLWRCRPGAAGIPLYFWPIGAGYGLSFLQREGSIVSSPCDECSGEGVRRGKATLTVRIPPGSVREIISRCGGREIQV